jgi:hypothetical protein
VQKALAEREAFEHYQNEEAQRIEEESQQASGTTQESTPEAEVVTPAEAQRKPSVKTQATTKIPGYAKDLYQSSLITDRENRKVIAEFENSTDKNQQKRVEIAKKDLRQSVKYRADFEKLYPTIAEEVTDPQAVKSSTKTKASEFKTGTINYALDIESTNESILQDIPEASVFELNKLVANHSERMPASGPLRNRMLQEVEAAEAELALRSPEEIEAAQVSTQPKSEANIQKGIQELKVNSLFDAGTVVKKPQVFPTPPTIKQDGIELEVDENQSTRLQAINEFRGNTATELPTEDNAQYQELVSQGFTEEEALNQIESDITGNVTGEPITVQENTQYPKVVRQAVRNINSINDEKPAPTNTQEQLGAQLNIETLVQSLGNARDGLQAAMDPEQYYATFDSKGERPDALEKRPGRVKAWLHEKKLPSSPEEAFKVRNPETRSLLNTVPGIVYAMGQDPVTREQIYKKLEVNTEAKRAGFEKYLEFHQDVKKALDDIRTGLDRIHSTMADQ